MNYKYTDSTNTVVTNGKDWSGLATVPEVQEWVSAGNTILAADPLPFVYEALTPRQIRQALTRAGLRTTVETAVAAGSQDLKDWWEYSTAFERLHPQVVAMGASLGQTDQQLNDLWTLGATL